MGVWIWRQELFVVQRPGEGLTALEFLPDSAQRVVRFDVALTAVPVGVRNLATDGHPMLIHYWAPWEQGAATQAALLDSLRREPEMDGLVMTIVCFDPFPSLARWVGRHRLRLSVLLDHDRALARALPCPSLPYTYVVDAEGRVIVAQAGRVDWWSEGTRQTLRDAAKSPAPRKPAGPVSLAPRHAAS
jgi:peroxiredoxin